MRNQNCDYCLASAMQEEVLKLILLALEDGSALSRKVLVLFVVQRLASQYPQASKTAIGHVVQLLYRASCFKVIFYNISTERKANVSTSTSCENLLRMETYLIRSQSCSKALALRQPHAVVFSCR